MPFRRATSADIALVTALTHAAYTPWIAVIQREPLPMQTDYAEAIQTHRIDIFDHPDPVALIEMIPHDDHLWLENVAVHPDHQGSGIGRHLITHAEQVARSLGLPQIRLLTNAAFTRNLRFYAAQGFAQTHLEPFKSGYTAYFTKHLCSIHRG